MNSFFSRANSLRFLFLVHRISGLLLVLFLPFHFFIFSLSLRSESLDSFFRWSDSLPVKFAEFGLVFLFAVHFLGGCRLLVLEFFGLFTTPHKKRVLGGLVILAGFCIGLIFLFRAL